MTSQKRFSIEAMGVGRDRSLTCAGGSILIDALVALGIAALFVASIASASLSARDIFDRARDHSVLLDAYQAHQVDFQGMLPGETRITSYLVQVSDSRAASSSQTIYVPVTLAAVARWYGNDRIETDLSASYASTTGQIYTPPPVDLVAVTAYRAPGTDVSGPPLCSPDLASTTLALASAPTSMLTPSRPPTIVPITLPVDPLLPLTDIQVRDGVAYVSADSAKSSDPDLIIVDISDPAHPVIRSSINTGPGIAALALSGAYIYAAADSTAAQLHVIHIASLSTPILAAKYQLPLPQASTTPPTGTAIFYDQGTLYLGTDRWDGQEVAAIDVSHPETPRQIGGFETGSKVNAIFVRNGLAYIAASDQDQLRTLDVHDPAHLVLESAFSPSGWQRQEGREVVSFESSLGFGRTSGGYDILTDPESFFWPNAASTSPSSSLDIPGGVYGILADRTHVYLATRTVGQEFTVLDHSLASSTASYYSLPVAPQAMTCDGDRIYILAHTAPVIYEITF